MFIGNLTASDMKTKIKQLSKNRCNICNRKAAGLFLNLTFQQLNGARKEKILNSLFHSVHVLRMEQKSIPKKGLRWNPPGKRKQ